MKERLACVSAHLLGVGRGSMLLGTSNFISYFGCAGWRCTLGKGQPVSVGPPNPYLWSPCLPLPAPHHSFMNTRRHLTGQQCQPPDTQRVTFFISVVCSAQRLLPSDLGLDFLWYLSLCTGDPPLIIQGEKTTPSHSPSPAFFSTACLNFPLAAFIAIYPCLFISVSIKLKKNLTC